MVRFLFLLAALALGVARAAPAFEVINGDLHTVWVRADGLVMLAGGTDSMLRRSADGGQSWRQVTLPAETSVVRIEADGAGVLLARSNRGLLRSDDEGQSWEASPLPGDTRALALLHDADRGRWLAAL